MCLKIQNYIKFLVKNFLKYITVLSFTIFFLKTGSVISVDVGPNDTVADIKYKIYMKDGIPATQQQLIFSGMSLANDSLISNYNIQQHSTVHLVMKSDSQSRRPSDGPNTLNTRPTSGPHPSPRPTSGPQPSPRSNSGLQLNALYSITCLNELQQPVRVNVHMNETVLILKERLAVKEGIVLRQNDIVLRMVGSNAELRDNHTLSAYGINTDTMLQMEIVQRNVCTLFIKTLNGKTFILSPMADVLVSHIKIELEEKSKIPANQQRLVYQGSDLPDNQTLVQCGVPTQCTLHVIQTNPPTTRPKLPLLVKTLVGKAITVYVGEGDTVKDIKVMISNREGYPTDEICVMMGGVELHEDKMLDYHQIQQGSTLLVTFKVKDKVRLQVYDTSRSKMLYLEGVHFSDSIGQVVKRLSMDTRVPPCAIAIVHNGQVLKDHVSVDQCDFTDDTIITLHLLKPKTLSVDVKTVAGLQCRVNLSSFEQVSALKLAIEDIYTIPSTDQVLVYRGKSLKDDMYMCDAISSSTCTVTLFSQMGVNRNIAVTVLPVGRVTRHQLPTETTITQLKTHISEEQRVPVQQVSFMYNGSELQSSCCLGDYLILDGAQVIASILSHEAILITVHPNNGGNTFNLVIDGRESVHVLKLRVAAQLDLSIDRVTLCYCGLYLNNDDGLIRDYRLPNPCVILAEIDP